ncbi:hypothetical protein I79_005407 [Cricetulus griseus]|uniref:Uncharacterized protein n=1 Tax=Cricetulus griseus TaxID=10029 RepID=G3H538_CRIGR|nr:hypothetical protein I79_005407 [Cricetulus griseus]
MKSPHGTLGLVMCWDVCLAELEDWGPLGAPMPGKGAPGSNFSFKYVLISQAQEELSYDFAH